MSEAAPHETAHHETTGAEQAAGIVVCDACPVLCRIRPGKTGACDRYGNVEGRLARLDPMLVAAQVADRGGTMVPFLEGGWDGSLPSATLNEEPAKQ